MDRLVGVRMLVVTLLLSHVTAVPFGQIGWNRFIDGRELFKNMLLFPRWRSSTDYIIKRVGGLESDRARNVHFGGGHSFDWSRVFNGINGDAKGGRRDRDSYGLRWAFSVRTDPRFFNSRHHVARRSSTQYVHTP